MVDAIIFLIKKAIIVGILLAFIGVVGYNLIPDLVSFITDSHSILLGGLAFVKSFTSCLPGSIVAFMLSIPIFSVGVSIFTSVFKG